MRRIATALFAVLITCSLATVASSQTAGFYPGYPFNSSYYISTEPTIYPRAYSTTGFYLPNAPTYSVPNRGPVYYPSYGSGGLEGYYANRGYPFRRWAGSRGIPYNYSPLSPY